MLFRSHREGEDLSCPTRRAAHLVEAVHDRLIVRDLRFVRSASEISARVIRAGNIQENSRRSSQLITTASGHSLPRSVGPARKKSTQRRRHVPAHRRGARVWIARTSTSLPSVKSARFPRYRRSTSAHSFLAMRWCAAVRAASNLRHPHCMCAMVDRKSTRLNSSHSSVSRMPSSA